MHTNINNYVGASFLTTQLKEQQNHHPGFEYEMRQKPIFQHPKYNLLSISEISFLEILMNGRN